MRLPRRVVPPTLAAGLALVAALNPTVPGTRELRDVLLVIDITRSMNVRDMDGRSRLEASRATMRDWVARQPCGTRVGLAIFTERRTLTLFTPVEICADFASLAGALEALDWRMAWEGDSMISKGLNHGLARAAELDAALVFVTDGHEAPPLPYSGPDAFRGESPGGIIVGVGGPMPSPIPKFDEDGREVGFYEASDVQHAPARRGPPPPDAASRPGFHPRNNPYGESDLEGSEHLSVLRASYLEQLAETRELGFVRLAEGPEAIDTALAGHASARNVDTPRSLGPLFGFLAFVAFLAGWLPRSRTWPLRKFPDGQRRPSATRPGIR